MPSSKLGTITKDVAGVVKGLVGGSEYREKLGVIRCAVGQLGFTPEEMQSNVKAFVGNVKKDLAVLSDRINKDIYEVVSLSAFVLRYLVRNAGCISRRCVLTCLAGIELDQCSWFQSKRRL